MKKSALSVKHLSPVIPHGATVIDAVTTAKFPLGAVLVRFDATGIYSLVSNSVVSSCNQREAKAYAEGAAINYNDQYQLDNIKRVVVKINRATQQDIIDHLSRIDNVQGYIIGLIKADMERTN